MAQIKVIGGGTLQPGVEAAVDPTWQAMRFAPRPLDYGTLGQLLGHYTVVGTTSAIAPAANSSLFAFRWTDASRLALIQSVWVGLSVVTAITAQRTDPIVMTMARAYTARDATNATALTMTGNNAKMATKMGTSLVGNIDVSNLAAGLTGGTKTLDANPVSFYNLINLVAIGSGQPTQEVFGPNTGDGEHPALLAQNEGFVLNWGATALATGTVEVTVKVRWAEITAF